ETEGADHCFGSGQPTDRNCLPNAGDDGANPQSVPTRPRPSLPIKLGHCRHTSGHRACRWALRKAFATFTVLQQQGEGSIFMVQGAAGAWRKRPSTILWMLSIGQLISWGLVYYTFPLFVVPMSEELGWSRSELYGALSAGLLVAGLSSIPVGA